MRSVSTILLTVIILLFTSLRLSFAGELNDHNTDKILEQKAVVFESTSNIDANTPLEMLEDHPTVPGWTVIPFVLLLLMIATGPLFYEHFWHKAYPTISLILADLFVNFINSSFYQHYSHPNVKR